MTWNPNSIIYVCIAKHTTILAEFNSKDAPDLTDLANNCLHKTPPFHSVFSHTVNGNTYMFFISDPFVYFGIFNESLEKPDCLLFLKSVKEAFTSMIDNCNSGTMKQRLNDYQRGSLDSVRRKKRCNKDELEEERSDDDVSVSSVCRLQRGRYIWKKQMMVVLSMDLVVCAGLFVIWLWVCNGFQCVAN